MSELKACPFCGGAAGLCKDDDGRWTQVECLSCGARSNEWPDDEKAPIAAWNRRAPVPVVTREEIGREIIGRSPHRAADALLAMLREKGVVG